MNIKFNDDLINQKISILNKPKLILKKNILIKIIIKLIYALINLKDINKHFLLKLQDGRIIDTKSWYGWEWTHGIALYALYNFYKFNNNQKIIKIIDNWFNYHLHKELPTKNINTFSPLLTLAYRYEDTNNQTIKPILEQWSNWIIYQLPRTKANGFQHVVFNNLNDQQLWDDTLMMTILPLIKIGKLLNKHSYIDESLYQFILHTLYLMDKTTGLWYHGWSFLDNHNFSKVFWGRGNCWVVIASIEILDLLQSYNIKSPLYKLISENLNKLLATLIKLQSSNGLWHTILDDNNSYLEASATAGFVYGILKGIRKQFISKDYYPIAIKSILGLTKLISKTGHLTQVSFGTGMGHTKTYYKNIPLTPMPYGQALIILALTEYLYYYL